MNRRALNHMDSDTKVIHARLEEWATWAKSGLHSVGWPRRTILGRLGDKESIEALSHGLPPVSMPDHIAVVDSAVARLTPPDDIVIKTYYLNWEPTQVLWKSAGLRSESSFKIILKRARWRIAGFIECAERPVVGTFKHV